AGVKPGEGVAVGDDPAVGRRVRRRESLQDRVLEGAVLGLALRTGERVRQQWIDAGRLLREPAQPGVDREARQVLRLRRADPDRGGLLLGIGRADLRVLAVR